MVKRKVKSQIIPNLGNKCKMTYDGNMWYDGVIKLKDTTLLEALQ
jgi:hypothetical protein